MDKQKQKEGGSRNNIWCYIVFFFFQFSAMSYYDAAIQCEFFFKMPHCIFAFKNIVASHAYK